MDTAAMAQLTAAHNKRKRTKRRHLIRPHSPFPFSTTTTTTAASNESTTTEEDTARCLILLARGGPDRDYYRRDQETNKNTNTTVPGILYTNTNTNMTVPGMYTCKTCDRAFGSFQALGGHRASHKKPRNERKSAAISSDGEEDFFPSPLPSTLSKKRMPSSSPRIHECSYCGAEFASGQALGWHMRRHRAGPISPASVEEPEPEETNKGRNGFSLDLNLPAPEDEKFAFGVRQQKSPTLVDCRY